MEGADEHQSQQEKQGQGHAARVDQWELGEHGLT